MGFKHQNGHEAIRFDASGVSGAAAVDGYLLRFSLAYEVIPWRSEFGDVPRSFRNFHARAALGAARLHLGAPQPQRPLVLTPYIHQQPGALMLELLLPASTIEKIEVHRAGGGFEVMLQLGGDR